MKSTLVLAVLCAVALVAFGCTPPGDPKSDTTGGKPADAPADPAADPPPAEDRVVLFGDLHSHTTYSFDSYTIWNSNTQNEAYRFAQGKTKLPLSEGHTDESEQPILDTPLDFAAITDHAEWFGELEACLDTSESNKTAYDSTFCQMTRDKNLNAFTELIALATTGENKPDAQHHPICDDADPTCQEHTLSVWQEIQNIANAHDAVEDFTTLIAYEYTGLVQHAGMQHRNVFFRNAIVPDAPIDSIDYPHAEDLWEQLELQCNNAPTGCEALAIPHNPNYSWGQMLDPVHDSQGRLHKQADLERRARIEPLIEIIQTKGNSECHPEYAFGNDELCDFEQVFPLCSETGGTDHCVDEKAFVRNAYKEGLVIEEGPHGVNPFKFGIIASMDTHNGITGATEEDQYRGHHGESDVTAKKRIGGGGVEGLTENPVNSPGGLAAVWADENSRDAIFDALKRKETFGTSGTRVSVRFFGSFQYPENFFDLTEVNLIEQAYNLGVPMGGDLHLDTGTPSFLIWATADPNSAPLQRVQIIKGWNVDTDTYEEVHDVICADGNPPLAGSSCPTASSADVDGDGDGDLNKDECDQAPQASGARDFMIQWTDKNFHPIQRAFYYVRVLEASTCRWSTYDAFAEGRRVTGDKLVVGTVANPVVLPTTIQERAWSSPIWYTPLVANP